MTERRYPCRLVRVVDADTVVVDVDHGFHISTRQTIRLAGINAPELGTSAGVTARQVALLWLTNSDLTLVSLDRLDKYGRRLGDLERADGERLTSFLLATDHAVPYEAGVRRR